MTTKHIHMLEPTYRRTSICGERQIEPASRNWPRVSCPDCIKGGEALYASRTKRFIDAIETSNRAVREKDLILTKHDNPIRNAPEHLRKIITAKIVPYDNGEDKPVPILLMYHPLYGFASESIYGVHLHIYPSVYQTTRFRKREDSQGNTKIVFRYFIMNHESKPIDGACIDRGFSLCLSGLAFKEKYLEFIDLVSLALSPKYHSRSDAYPACRYLLDANNAERQSIFLHRNHLKVEPIYDFLADVDEISI